MKKIKLEDLEIKDGRYYYTFTPKEDMTRLEISSDCLGDTRLNKIQIEQNANMTYWVPPEVYEGKLSGIFENMNAIRFQMLEPDSEFWGKIQITARGMLEEYHTGTLSAEFMKTAGGIETRLTNKLAGVENRYSETAEAIRREIRSIDGRVNSVTETLDGFKREVSNSLTGVRSSITQLSSGIEQRIQNTEGNFSQLSQTVNKIQNVVSGVNGLESRITQLDYGISQRIDDRTSDKFSSITQTINGIQRQITGSGGLSTQINELAGLIDQRVTRNDLTSIIQSSGDAIMFALRNEDIGKMSGEEILSAINITTGGIYAHSGKNKLVITPDTTYIEDGTIKSAMIEELSASKITTGELNAALVRIVNLDAMSITSNRANLLRASFQALNSNMHISGTELRLQNYSGSFIELNTQPEVRSVSNSGKEVVLGDGRVHFKDGRAVTNGYIGVDLHTGTNKLGIYLSRGTDFFQIAQGTSGSYGSNDEYYTVQSGDGWNRISANTGVSVNTLLNLNGATIDTMIHPGDQILVRRGTHYSSGLTYESYIRFGMNSSRTNHEIYMDKPVTMTASPKISSDRRIKKNIKDTHINALNEIEKLVFKSFNLTDTNEYYPIGLIAQEAGMLMRYNGTDDIYTLDLMTGLMLALKGIKELNEKVENLCQKKLA